MIINFTIHYWQFALAFPFLFFAGFAAAAVGCDMLFGEWWTCIFGGLIVMWLGWLVL